MGYAVGAADLCAAGVGAPHIRQRLFWVADAMPAGRAEGRAESRDGQTSGGGCAGGLGDANSSEKERFRLLSISMESEQETGRPNHANSWADFRTVGCADGKTRRIEPGSFPLAHGIPGRVGLLRGYGNAIVPQVAAEFIQAALDPEF